jgi:CheY-specific phosphatase CheX
MNQTLSRRLVEVTAETLEKLAFIFAFPVAEAPAMDGQSQESVGVDFSGPFCGGMELSLPASALGELAVNMVGAEEGEQLSAEQQRDALKELANVVCGNLLPVLAGNAAEFNLQPPYIVSDESPMWINPAAVGYLMLESGACRVRMRVDRALAQDLPGLNPADVPS